MNPTWPIGGDPATAWANDGLIKLATRPTVEEVPEEKPATRSGEVAAYQDQRIRITEFERRQIGVKKELTPPRSQIFKGVAHAKISSSAPTPPASWFRPRARSPDGRRSIRYRLKPDQSGSDCQVDVQ
jgi:hypothetical protein